MTCDFDIANSENQMKSDESPSQLGNRTDSLSLCDQTCNLIIILIIIIVIIVLLSQSDSYYADDDVRHVEMNCIFIQNYYINYHYLSNLTGTFLLLFTNIMVCLIHDTFQAPK